jgi:hypothetical protein
MYRGRTEKHSTKSIRTRHAREEALLARPRLLVGLVWNLDFLVALVLCSLILLPGGCKSRTSTDSDATAPRLLWREEALEFRGTSIKLGFRGETSASGSSIEPVAAISRDAAPVADAMVFIALTAPGGTTTENALLANEAATLYEPPSGQTPALYTAGRLSWPESAGSPAARFRVVLPDAEEDFIREVAAP